MPNVMSLPNRGDQTLGNNKKKSGGGVDASMITRMKREQAIVSDQRTEPRRFGASVGITDITGGDGTGPLVYTFDTPGYIPFVPGEQVGVSGNTASIVTGSSPTTASATISTAKITNVFTGGVVTFTLPTTGVLKVGQTITLGGSVFGGSQLNSSTTYTISALNGTTATLTDGVNAITTTETTIASPYITVLVTGGGSLTTLTYTSTSAPVFVVGDLINVSNHTTPAHNGNSLLVTAVGNTSVQYQTNVTTSTNTSTAAVTITPVSSRYNGNFTITACTSINVTMALPAGRGPSILGAFTDGRNTGTIVGNRPIGQVFEAIVDKPMTRGFTDGPVMPFFRRSASLGFYRVL